MGIQLDLSKAHRHRVHGHLIAIYTWMNDERCLILISRYRPKAPWYVVMESAAWKYDDPAYLACQCVKACEVLGFEPSRNNWVKIATIIHEGLPDLVGMPSSPAEELIQAEFGRMQLKANGKVIAEQAIQLPKAQVEYQQA